MFPVMFLYPIITKSPCSGFSAPTPFDDFPRLKHLGINPDKYSLYHTCNTYVTHFLV